MQATVGHFYTFSALPPGADSHHRANGKGDRGKKKSSRKRRDTGRRFRCDHDDCGKTYNSPKELFECDHANCSLTFVRKDLRDRHRKRHRVPSTSVDPDVEPKDPTTDHSSSSSLPSDDETDQVDHFSHSQSNDTDSAHSTQMVPDRKHRLHEDPMVQNEFTNRAPSHPFSAVSKTSSQYPASASSSNVLHSNLPFAEVGRTLTMHEYSHNGRAPSNPSSLPEGFEPRSMLGRRATFDDAAGHHRDRIPMADTGRHSFSHTETPGYPVANSVTYGQGLITAEAEASHERTATPAFTHSLEHHDMDVTYDTARIEDGSYGISPSGQTDEFTAWLFDQNGAGYSDPSVYQPNVFGQLYYHELPTSMFDQYAELNDFSGSIAAPDPPATYPVSFMDPSLSDWKRRQLLAIIQERFSAGGPAAMAMKQQLFHGNVDDPSHVMSLNSLQTYIASYFAKFDHQLPLLHKTSFIPDQSNDCLLLSVLVVGASLLDVGQHGNVFCESAAQFANLVAWSLRWHILMDLDSGPPAKLWVLQALAILEFYEKMNATRALHERAHVHFAATLTLMRRGSALIGEQSTPPSRDETNQPGESSDDRWWNHWIAQEATRRSALGAFFLDALHATMFGHAAIMVIHEIQLPLPCDDTLWSASTASEVGRIEFSLHTNGIKPTMFITGIKRTLSSQKVRTNPFGRIILMAGLMSIAYHMRQKELYQGTLEERNLAVPEGWKGQLTKAFDFWKQDFDESFAHMAKSGIDGGKTGFSHERSIISQHLATGLYHLAHIGLQVDMPDLCILAGAKVLLGRVVGKADQERIRDKMKKWVDTSGARYAVFYSVRYLKLTLFPDATTTPGRGYGSSSTGTHWAAPDRVSGAPLVSPEVVLIRPWVMYFSALVIWAYGFLLEGPLRPFPESIYRSSGPGDSTNNSTMAGAPPNPGHTVMTQEMRHDAELYLHAMGRFTHPKGLQGVTSGRNRVVGVVGMVLAALEGSRWELLREARLRLHNCLEQLR